VRRFVPEAVPDAGIGTLIARRSCGTVSGPEAATFQLCPAIMPETLVCGPVETHCGDRRCARIAELQAIPGHGHACVNAWTESLPSSITSYLAESTVNAVIGKRFAKGQQMQ
jgi:hypothetical protein